MSSCLIKNAIPCRANCQILFNADLLYVVASNLLSQIYKQIGILFPGHKMALVYKKVKIWQIRGMDIAGVLRRQICNLLTCGTCSSWSILAPNFGWFYQLSLFQLSKRYPENPKYITQEVQGPEGQLWGLGLPDIVLRAFGTQAAWYGTPLS